MPTGVPSPPAPSPPIVSAPGRSVARNRSPVSPGRSSPDRGRSSRRRERSSLRRERAVIRRRLATPPPDYPSGPFDDPEDNGSIGANGTDGASGHGSDRRRMRVRLALAALPLVVAVALFAATGTGPGDDPARMAAQDTARAEDSGMAGVALVPDHGPGAMDATVSSDVAEAAEAADTAAVAGTLPQQDPAGTFPGHHIDGDNTGGDSVERDGADALRVPAASAGHRPVALRIADPAALSLVTTGDHVDVVAMDGSVLAERLEVLQDRSSGASSVLVLAIPDGASAEVAAAALSREVTVILSGEPTAQGSGP
jgi:hypothetical protein